MFWPEITANMDLAVARYRHGADLKTGKFSLPPDFMENNAKAIRAPDALPQ
jgi:hypothetical protein